MGIPVRKWLGITVLFLGEQPHADGRLARALHTHAADSPRSKSRMRAL